MKKFLAIFAALAAIGLEAHLASAAARTCDSVLTPGEGLAEAAANCPPSTTFTIKDGSYKLSRPINADSGDILVRSEGWPDRSHRQPHRQ